MICKFCFSNQQLKNSNYIALFFLILNFTLLLGCQNQQKTIEVKEPKIITSAYYEFHNNYWLNLHHFLYQKARGSQKARQENRGKSLLSIGEEKIYPEFNTKDSIVLNEALAYYKSHIIKKDLLRDLRHMQLWFQEQKENEKIIDTSFGSDFTKILNNFSEIYKSKFWNLHKSHNEKIIQKHITTIQSLETDVITELQIYANYQWPSKTKARIDLLAYANYAGAYTITEPQMNIFISTLDSDAENLLFIETIFHEGAHLLFKYRDSPIRDEIFLKSKELGMKHPSQLWHACLFYLTGRTVQDIYKDKGIDEDYSFYFDQRNVYKNYNNPKFRQILERYYQKEINYQEVISELLLSLK